MTNNFIFSGDISAAGCGDPACKICGKGEQHRGPEVKGGLGSSVGGFSLNDIVSVNADLSPLSSSSLSDYARMMDEVQITLRNSVERSMINNYFGVEPKKNEDAISAEERALKAKVEKYFLKTEHQVGWDDVVGNDDAREALFEAIEYPVKHAELYQHYGMTPPKGVLLYGPPGCGKTMFGKAAARAIAALHGGADVPLLKINGPEIQTPFIGATEAIIRDVFAYARAFAKRTGRPLVIFIDEADAILPSRDGAGGRRAAPWEESQVAQFLTEMDGLETSGAFVILATNRPHAIDAALLRDGRCDRKIKVRRPNQTAADTILYKALLGVPHMELSVAADLANRAAEAFFDPSLRIATIYHSKGSDPLTLGHICNGAMLNGLVAQAKAVAFRRDLASGSRSGLGFADLEAAIAAICEQNRPLNHAAAVEDFAETYEVDVKDVTPWRTAT